ncbi:MAG: hypothetical protein Q8P18_05930 [Pseudomonadota bacterium]|nr:hypothetical protein [Pseudomonadota bacterium]
MLTLTMLLACGGAGEAPATGVMFDNARSGTSATTVQGALDELYVRCKLEAAADEPTTTVGASSELTNALSGRVQLLELRQSELASGMAFGATSIAYDPRKTTLAGKTVQDALDELEARVTKLERGQIDNGEAGPGLFELRDKRGNLVPVDAPAQSANGKGGPQGPPPGQPGGPPKGQPTRASSGGGSSGK